MKWCFQTTTAGILHDYSAYCAFDNIVISIGNVPTHRTEITCEKNQPHSKILSETQLVCSRTARRARANVVRMVFNNDDRQEKRFWSIFIFPERSKSVDLYCRYFYFNYNVVNQSKNMNVFFVFECKTKKKQHILNETTI